MYKILHIFFKWCLSADPKPRSMTLVLSAISILVSNLIFSYLIILQIYSIIASRPLSKDLAIVCLLNTSNITQLVDRKELTNLTERVYLSAPTVRYVLFFDKNYCLSSRLSVFYPRIHNPLQLQKRLFSSEKSKFLLDKSLVNFAVPLNFSISSLDILNLETNPSLAFPLDKFPKYSSLLIFIWYFFAVNFVLNTLIFSNSIDQLLLSTNNIAFGNLSQKVNCFKAEDLESVALSFNKIAQKLQSREKKNVDELILEKDKLETIASMIADGVILIDTELRILFVNKTAQKVFNWLNLDLIGFYISTCLPCHINEALLPLLNKLLKLNYSEQNISSLEEVCISTDYTSKKICRFTLATIFDRTSQALIGITIVIQDISREVKLSDAKNQFISNISHELRTPLCNIGSFLETLLDYDKHLSYKQKKHFLTIANNETKRLSLLVNDILALSRLESECDYKLTDLDLGQILNSVVNTSQITACKNNIELIVELDPEIHLILAHESSLFQVIINLIGNALKFSSDYSRIILRVYKLISVNTSCEISSSDKLIRIEIIDEGIGITEEDQKLIFDRFVRIENSVHDLESTGLGLSIVKNILSKHKTTPLVQSELKVGTSVWFDLKQID